MYTRWNRDRSLKRNNVYKLTVNSVKKEGYATELEAYKGALTSLSYSINYWDMDSHGTVQFDGDNILAIPSKKVLFTPNGGSYDLGMFTLGEGTLSVSKKGAGQRSVRHSERQNTDRIGHCTGQCKRPAQRESSNSLSAI